LGKLSPSFSSFFLFLCIEKLWCFFYYYAHPCWGTVVTSRVQSRPRPENCKLVNFNFTL
jgi:hypothetical protein